jgi:hypothetical protein
MEYKPIQPPRRNIKKVMLLIVSSLLVIGLIGFGTVTLLHKIKAPTISDNTKTQTTTPTAPAPAATPEKALQLADKAKAAAVEKATAGDQKAALVDYKTALTNYKLAEKPDQAADAQFAIDTIEAALAVPEHPATSLNAKTSSKE